MMKSKEAAREWMETNRYESIGGHLDDCADGGCSLMDSIADLLDAHFAAGEARGLERAALLVATHTPVQVSGADGSRWKLRPEPHGGKVPRPEAGGAIVAYEYGKLRGREDCAAGCEFDPERHTFNRDFLVGYRLGWRGQMVYGGGKVK